MGIADEILKNVDGPPKSDAQREDRTSDNPFKLANGVDPASVLDWLSIERNGKRIQQCPGCGASGGVDVLDHGWKCQHQSCADRGLNGFRTNVDTVMELRGVGKVEAVNLIAAQFGTPTIAPRNFQKRRPAAPDAPLCETASDRGLRKPRIVIGTDQERVVTEAVAALAAASTAVFQRGNALVRLVSERNRMPGIVLPVSNPTIGILPVEILSMLLATAADWIQIDEDGERRVHPPLRTVRQVSALAHWPGIRDLAGIVEAPTLRPDGSVLDQPGYDAATALLFAPNCEFLRVSDRPAKEDAAVACAVLLEAVEDFPFAGPAHKAAWLAGVLTLFCRRAIDGPTPIEVIEAPERGTGKGLLAEVQAEIATGRTMPVMPDTADGEELRKRITSLVIAGIPAVLLDNVTGLGGSVLDAALTSTVWSDRVLGSNRTITLPMSIMFLATGNNIQLRGDIVRRVLLVRLEADCERPDSRGGFHHDPLIQYVRRNRARLVQAALTIPRAYVVAGRPTVSMAKWGRFEAWSDLVRASLIWAGQPDPHDTREKLEEGDYESAAVAGLFDGLARVMHDRGEGDRETLSAAEIASILESHANTYTTLCSSIAELERVRPGKPPTAKQIGYLLRRFRHRVVGSKRLCVTPKTDQGRRYYVETVRGARITPADADNADDGSLSGQGGERGKRDTDLERGMPPSSSASSSSSPAGTKGGEK